MNRTSLEKYDAFIEAIATDFETFCKELLPFLPKRVTWTKRERWMAFWAQDGPPFSQSIATRGCAKTHILGIDHILWRGLRDPNRRSVVVSKSHGHAVKALSTIRNLVSGRVPFLAHLAPKSNQRDTTKYFDFGTSDHDTQPSVSSYGIQGQLPGNRAHSVYADDVETKENSATQEARAELDDKTNEFIAWMYSDSEPLDQCEVKYIGTYHHVDSMYFRKFKSGFYTRTWPILCPTESQRVIGLCESIVDDMTFFGMKPGDPVFKHRWTVEQAEKIRQKVGETYWAMQFMCLADLGEALAYPLKLRDLIVHSLRRGADSEHEVPASIQWSPAQPVTGIPCMGMTGDTLNGPLKVDDVASKFTGIKAVIDPAGVGGDESAVAVVGHLGGYFYVLGCAGFQGGATRTDIDRLVQFCRLHGATQIHVEKNIDTFGTFRQTLEESISRHFVDPGRDPNHPRGWKASMEVFAASSRHFKEQRICDILEPVLGAHRVVIDPACLIPERGRSPEFQLQHQLSYMRRERRCLPHDDRLDALAHCIRLWSDEVRESPETAREVVTDRMLEDMYEEVNRFYRQFGGYPKHQDRVTWRDESRQEISWR